MKYFKSMAIATTVTLALGLAGCGGSSSDSPAAVSTSKTVSLNGSLEPGAAKLTIKAVGAVATSLGSVVAIDAATGAVLSNAPVDIVPDNTGTSGTFSGLSFTPPSTQAGVVLKVTLTNGKIYRSLVTLELQPQTAPVTVAAIGPNSDVIVTSVSGSLGLAGVLGDSGVKVPAGTKLAELSSTVATVTSTVLPKLAVGYVINTGGSLSKLPGFSIVDRKTNAVTKTIRYTDGTKSIGHFANVSADGSQLWLCSNDPNGGVGVVNVLDTSVFGSYSTLNSSNKANFVKKSFDVGCGIQNTQTPDGRYLFTSRGDGAKGINVFDTKELKFLGNIPNGNTAPHVGAVSPDGKVYYTTTAGSFHAVGYDISGLPAKVPTDADKVLDVDFGYGNLHALRLHPNGKYLFVGNSTWPVPSPLPSTIAASTSGLNVIDIAAKKIIKTVPGRPHNYAISLDGKYLASTESTAADCNITPNDPGALVQFLDISTLLAGTPDPARIVSLYQFIQPGYGGSHAAWDQTTGLFYYSVSDSTGQGWLYTLNTAKLSAATPSVDIVVDKAKIGWAPHGISYAGINGD